MKYIKLTGWGNSKTHIVPLKAINSFSEEDKYTSIRLDNGTTINVQETFHVIEELLDLAGVVIYDVNDLNDQIEQSIVNERLSQFYMDDDEDLPF